MDLLPAVLDGDYLQFNFLARKKRVFIIHGHDPVNLEQLQNMLYKLNLVPVVMKEHHAFASLTIIEKFEKIGAKCTHAVAICTPDDMVNKKNDSTHYFQPRPNVIYEIGWFCAKIGRKKVVLLVKQGTDIFSDFQGVVHVNFHESVKECFEQLFFALKGRS